MQKKSSKSNQKQQNAVQNVSAENNAKTPQIKKSQNPKVSRAKFACNPKLAEFIDIANLLPWEKDKNLQLVLSGLHMLPSKTTSLHTNNSLDFFKREAEALKNLPAEVSSYIVIRLRDYAPLILREALEIFSEPDEISDSFIWASKILYSSAIVKELYLIRKTFIHLEELARFLEIQKKPKEGLSPSRKYVPRFYEPELNSRGKYIDSIPLENREYLIKPKRSVGEIIGITDVDFDEEGNIEFRLSPLAEALQGVNITRLRKCEICPKFFWAKRKDAFTCSKLHAKRRRMRLLRQIWIERGGQYVEARRKKNKENKVK